jgi:hypothetical protein
MTTSAVVPTITFPGSGGAGTFGPFSLVKSGTPVYFTANSQIKVYRYATVDDDSPALLVEGTDYTLTGKPSAGSITLTPPQTALLSAHRLHVVRVQPVTQDLDLTVGGNYAGPTIEARLDRMVEMIQENRREIGTAMRFTPFSTDRLPDGFPMEAAIDNIPYITGTAAEPEFALYPIDNGVADISAVAAQLDDITLIASDLNGADTIGTVAASIINGTDISYTEGTYAGLTAITAAARYDGMLVYVSARAAVGDGGEGHWRFDSASVAVANGGTILAPDAGTGRWLRVSTSGDVWLKWFGTDTAAMSAAITAAGVNGRVLFSPGSYTLTAKLTMLAFQTLEGIGNVTLTKAFNGDMIEAGAVATQIKNLQLEGAGATFTGAGVTYTTAGNGYQYTEDLWVLNTAGAPLKFATADAGQKSAHYWGLFRCFTSTLHGIELPQTGTETVGGREFVECEGDGSPLIKFGVGVVTRIVGGGYTGLDFSASAGVSLRASIIGSRIATSAVAITLNGNDTIIQGCQIAGGLTVAANAARNIVGPNNHASGTTIQDSSGLSGADANQLYQGFQTFTPTWGVDTGGAPVLGNGTLAGELTHNGRSIRATVSFLAGSTTTFGGGVWTFTLPAGFVAKRQTHGSGQSLDSGTAVLSIIPVMAAGSNVIRLIATSGAATGSANLIGPTIPITWANGDTFSFTIDFDRL